MSAHTVPPPGEAPRPAAAAAAAAAAAGVAAGGGRDSPPRAAGPAVCTVQYVESGVRRRANGGQPLATG
jgi:hypothetical protein